MRPVHAGVTHRPCNTGLSVALSCRPRPCSSRSRASSCRAAIPPHKRDWRSTSADSSTSKPCSAAAVSLLSSSSTTSSSCSCRQQAEERRSNGHSCSTSYSQTASCQAHNSSMHSIGSKGTNLQQQQPLEPAPLGPAAAPAAPLADACTAAAAACLHYHPGSPGAAALGFSSRPPAPLGLGGKGLPLPHRHRQQPQARAAVRTAAFAGAAAVATQPPWHHAVGLSLRGVMWGIAFTLGSQLLLALLLRTLWAQRAIAALESWLQAVFGVSLRGSRRAAGSALSSMDEEETEEDDASSSAAATAAAAAVASVLASGMSRSSSTGSSSSSSSTGSDTSSMIGNSRKAKKARAAERAALAALVHNAPGESVEWVNMCFRKIWRVYQRGLERWITDLLQPVFDGLIQPGTMPTWLLRLRIVELTLDHEAPYFSNMRRRNSRKDSDLTGVVDLRYTGGARLLLMLELGQGRWRFKIPVLVSDLDVQCALWLKLRLAPMCPWIGTISLAFVGPPAVKVQLSPYNRVRLMRIPVLQNLLNRLLTVDLPGLMVLPERLEISVPPSVTSIAEAAVGRDTIMRAVASAVLQVDSLEQALLAALPLGPQAAAGGVSLPELFRGELTVLLREGRDLPVWGMPWQSNPWVRLVMGEQAVASRRDSETSTASRHGAPVWNQEVQFLVEDPEKQVLEVYVNDSHLTGRPKVGKALLALKDLPPDGRLSAWVPLEAVNPGQRPQGEVLLDVTFKTFEDDEQDSGYREAQEYARAVQQQSEAITDIRSAAAASSRAAVAASAAISAIAMTKAAAARAAARAAQAAKDAGAAALNTAAAVTQQQLPQQQQQHQQPAGSRPDKQAAAGDRPLMLPPPAASSSSRQQQQAKAKAAGKDKDDHGGGGVGGNGAPPSTAAVDGDGEAAAAAAARRREEALIEALEARMAFRVRSTSGTPKPGAAGGSLGGNGAGSAAAGSGSLSSSSSSGVGRRAGADADADMTATLPADSLMSDSSGEEDEALAVERAQKAVVDILEKSKRMEAAVAELAALTAGTGSATEAALQQGAIRAAADAVAALSAFQSTDVDAAADAPVSSTAAAISAAVAAKEAVVTGGSGRRGSSGSGGSSSGSGGSSSGSGGSSSAAAVADRELQPHGSSNGSSSNGKGFSNFASGYSIWGEEQQQSGQQQPEQQSGQQQPEQQQQQQLPGAASDYSIWGEQQLEPLTLPQQEPPQQHIPSIVVRVKDGEHVLSEVVGDSSHDKAVQTGAAGVDKAVQAAMTDRGPAVAVSKAAASAAAAGGGAAGKAGEGPAAKPWWSSVIFWLPGQKGADSTSSSDEGSSSDSGSVSSTQRAESSEPHTASVAPQRPWWQPLMDNDFVKSLPGVKKGEQAGTSSSSSKGSSESGEQQQDSTGEEGKKKPWWELDLSWLPRFGGSSDDEDGSSKPAADGSNKPVEAIVIPADLPLEEIAREVAKLKQDAWRSKEDHLENLWARTVDRGDRSWLILMCFLLSVAIGLLCIVAFRISAMHGGDPAAVVDAGAVVQQLPVMLLAVAVAAMAHWGVGL